MARKDPQFNVRMPQELKEMIEASAKDNQRSINAEIVHHLRNAMEAAGYIHDDLVGAYKPADMRYIDSPSPKQTDAPVSIAPRRVYERKEKVTLQTDISKEDIKELMAKMHALWSEFLVTQESLPNAKDEEHVEQDQPKP